MEVAQTTLRNIAVKDYMDSSPATVKSGTPITEVVTTLLSTGRTGIAVVDDKKSVVGFVSEQDCLKPLIQSSYHCDMPVVVDDVMRRDVLTVSVEDSIIELAQSMSEKKPKIYPVIQAGKMVGVIDRKRILAALKDNQQTC